MKRVIIQYLALMAILIGVAAGCNSSDFKATIVAQGQPAPHNGYNIGPSLWVQQGEPCPVSGAVIWLTGTEPNDLFGE